jgi:hypothetical protein
MRAVFYLLQEFFAKDEIKKTSFCRRKKELKEKFIFYLKFVSEMPFDEKKIEKA